MKKSVALHTIAVLGIMSALGASALAGNLYFQGFETNTSGWSVSSGGDNNGSIARTPSGGGALGLTAFDGSYYAEVRNDTNDYLPGYGTGGFSFFEGDGLTPPPYPGSGFSQSISVYIKVDTAVPANPNDAGFAIDMSPGTTLTSDPCYPAACADEQLFRLFYTGSSVNVKVPEDNGNNTSTVYTIGSSGWYTFQITYQPGGSGTVTNDMNIFGGSGQLLSSTFEAQGTNQGLLANADLAGPGYVWLPQWQNGFSDNVLGIDDVRADTIATPEPAAGALLLVGLVGFALLLTTRRQRKSSIQG